MKLNFWESFALSTGVSALEALVGNTSSLNDEQKADINTALASLQKVQDDFAA